MTESSNSAFELTLTEFLKIANLDYTKARTNWLVVVVQVGENKPEYIFNPRENISDKLAYYKKAYDENLVLKANPDIRIVQYDFVSSLQEFMTLEEIE